MFLRSPAIVRSTVHKLVTKVQSRMSLHMCIKIGAISPKSLHIATSIYHKDKTDVLYSKRCNITYVFAYVYSKRAISPMSLHMCIQNGIISPKSLHIAASDISQDQTWCCVFKTVQFCPMSLHIAASGISQGQNWCCIFKNVQYRPKSLHIAAL